VSSRCFLNLALLRSSSTQSTHLIHGRPSDLLPLGYLVDAGVALCLHVVLLLVDEYAEDFRLSSEPKTI